MRWQKPGQGESASPAPAHEATRRRGGQCLARPPGQAAIQPACAAPVLAIANTPFTAGVQTSVSHRSPKLTDLSLCEIHRVWFLLLAELGSGLRGQFHRSLTTAASAPHSTGVFTLRRTA